MNNIIKNYINQGTSKSLDAETNRRIMVVNLFAAVGMSLTFVLGLRALYAQDMPLATTLLAASVVFALSQRVQVHFASKRARLISISLLLSCLMLLVAILVVSGGNALTGPLWMYLVPPVTMFFAGFVYGLVTLAGFTLIIAFLLFYPNDALVMVSYSYEFKTRLLYSFLTVSFLSAFYEYSRHQSYVTALYLSEQFEKQASQDPLTRLMNRRGIQSILDNEISRLHRSKTAFTIAIADIDKFKNINDTLGHELGDEVLKRVANIFVARLRGHDAVARWGGEEFLFVFPETKEEDALIVLESLRKTLADSPIIIDGVPLNVTSSFGFCEVTGDTALSSAISIADKALYAAKHQGRNQVCVGRPSA